MTDNQLFALFQPVAPMPADVSERIKRRVFSYLRRQRIARRVVALVALFVWATTQAASAQVPLMVTAVVHDTAGQPMPGVMVDVTVAGQDASSTSLMFADDDGRVLIVADVGDTVTVRAGSNCHLATWTVAADNEPRRVTPSCKVWMPVIEAAGQADAATRVWGR